MDILDLIQEDHDEALEMIEKLSKQAKKSGAKIEDSVRELVVAVKLHAKSEEAALYRVLEGDKKDLREFCLEGYNEHECLDMMLDKLLTLEPGEDGELQAALTVCKELIEHHGKEEEEEDLFPKLRKAFSKDELMGMAATMQSEKERLRPEIEAMVDGQGSTFAESEESMSGTSPQASTTGKSEKSGDHRRSYSRH